MAVECLDTYEVFITQRYREEDDLQAIVDLLQDDYGVQTTVNDVHYHLVKWELIPVLSPVHLIDDWQDWHPNPATLSSYHRCQHCISRIDPSETQSFLDAPLTRYRMTSERHEQLAYGFYHYEAEDWNDLENFPRLLLDWLPLSFQLEKLFPSGKGSKRRVSRRSRSSRPSKRPRRHVNPMPGSSLSDTDATESSVPSCRAKLSIVTASDSSTESSLGSPQSVSMILTDEAGSPQVPDFPSSPVVAFEGLETSSAPVKRARASSERGSDNKRQRLDDRVVESD